MVDGFDTVERSQREFNRIKDNFKIISRKLALTDSNKSVVALENPPGGGIEDENINLNINQLFIINN